MKWNGGLNPQSYFNCSFSLLKIVGDTNKWTSIPMRQDSTALLYLDYHKLRKKLRCDGMGEGKRLSPWKAALASSPHWHHSCCSNHPSCQHTCLSCSPVSCFHTHKIKHWPGHTLLTIQSQLKPAYSWTYPCFSECYFFSKPNNLVKQSLQDG